MMAWKKISEIKCFCFFAEGCLLLGTAVQMSDVVKGQLFVTFVVNRLQTMF